MTVWRAPAPRTGAAGALLFGALAVVAAGLGALYSATAYALDPAALPLLLAVLAAVLLGLWRLELGLALLIVLTPFAENAPISHPGEAKLRVGLILWAVALASVQGARVVFTRERLRSPPLLGAALAFLAAALLAVPVAADEAAAASKFLLYAGSVAIYLLVGAFVTSWSRLRWVFAALVLAGLAISVHALVQYGTGQVSTVGFVSASGTVEYRVASFFSHPNQLAGFLAIFVPLGAGFYRAFESRIMRGLSIALILLATAGALVTFSRGALVALAGLALLSLRHKRAWPVVAVGVAAIVLLAPGTWRERVSDAGTTSAGNVAGRLDVWEAAATMFAQKPLLGVGLNNFGPAYLEIERPGRAFLGYRRLSAPETAHNLYLNTLAEQGLVGAGAMLLLVVAFVRMALTLGRAEDPRTRAMGRALMGVGVVLLFHNVFDVTFLDPKTSTMVWAVFGVGAALHLGLPRTPSAPRA